MDVNATISSAAGLLGNLTLAGILSALLTLVLCLIVKKIVMTLFTKAFARTKLDNHLAKIVLKAIEIVLWVVIILIVCEALGINVTSLLALFSVVGLAFSLALQDSLANMASGLLLMANRPFKLGDYVEAGGQEGTVQNIGLVYTEMTTPDNKKIHVPNSAISTGKIINYSCEPTRRVEIAVSASYDTPTEAVRAAALEAAANNPKVLKDPAPVVFLADYGDSAIRYSIRVWVKNADYWAVHFGLREALRESFAKHNVVMTYNHVNVHLMKD